MEPKVANMNRSGDGNGVEENRRSGLTTEYEGDVGTLGSIHLDKPSLATTLDTGQVVLKDWKVVLGLWLLTRIQVLTANIARRMLEWFGMSAAHKLYRNGPRTLP